MNKNSKNKVYKEVIEGCKGYKGFSTYDVIFAHKKDIIRSLQSLKP